MKISSKGRYGLAVMVSLAQVANSGEYVSIISIAERLGISKIYLEQVFSLLKRAELVNSVKGAQGGYQLSKAPDMITAGDVLHATEHSLFEKTDSSISSGPVEIEKAMEASVWNKLDSAIAKALDSVTLSDLVGEAERHKGDNYLMFYI
ncbi:HTH-type transcriptional regulator CymR (plasmid) [Peptoclostridium acidaminophilum DSM 3953]|uniref:HTH-type transcriptional regulator CymR n=1 Tax=Peptoclostridium acidaminophilum DSM 3953 TaxID=1286171 RepID=W8TPX1_PEPAC|nr:Rrf2 family transcriptional regulator [Peptoclostridium acidaminophilum]AHM58142.1 HTH-type transcriptional regulator CymR [Peptoclostridium acidaminophilum DSM 3953]